MGSHQHSHFGNILNNSHMRYIPKTRMKFNYLGGDGPMCLLYDDGVTDYAAKMNTWKVYFLGALAPSYFASITLTT